MPKIDNKFEKFDQDHYNKIYKKDIYLAYDKLSDGTYIEMDQSKNMKSYVETPLNSYYRITKIYYTNGNIKSKGLSSNTGYFQKDIWYEFDEQGNLIKETDYDKPFKFTFEDILKFCEKENIEIKKGPISQSGWHNIISRKIETDKPIWKIERLKRSDLVEIITLDGITGKVIKRETEEYLNN
ncbi:hypothetical protein BBH99_16800 [Chryseobacterium contaminans]|uniref:YD repeat-containing protein n=3 Tax=Chryseobacterium contaminans TaxID=1423959 RepID=A0ABX2XB81_9FLAO|nr:hypothetical protein BBH99_16800 [Chryseobacterium contaminans]